ncbi:hypothetical protein BC938DRAFT_483153, partial [Jimgerdemannia flammicorona]
MSLPIPHIKAHTGSFASLPAADKYDGLIAVFTSPAALTSFSVTAKGLAARDEAFGSTVQLIIDENVPGGRVVLAPTGSLNGDVDDVRRVFDLLWFGVEAACVYLFVWWTGLWAHRLLDLDLNNHNPTVPLFPRIYIAHTATKRALSAGILRPLIHFVDPPSTAHLSAFTYSPEPISDYARFLEVTLLGVLAASFDPIDVREHYHKTGKKYRTLECLGVIVPESVGQHLGEGGIEKVLHVVKAIEEGRRIMKAPQGRSKFHFHLINWISLSNSPDIGSPDPERMSPRNCAAYIRDVAFARVQNVKVTITEDHDVIAKDLPGWLEMGRHHPRIVKLEYKSPDQSKVKEKYGVTYDTGGADIKAGGVMRSMSRDKCGAASVAGFLKTVSLLAPTHVNITAGLSFVRNSIGSDSFVSDESAEKIWEAEGVLIGNTDAEGRLVMTDLLTEFKDAALANRRANSPVPSLLFTVATLTGHALRAYGGYGIALDANVPARQHRVSRRIFDAGHVWSDPFEISTFRREDIDIVAPGSTSEDVVQANDKPSSATMRGHQ